LTALQNSQIRSLSPEQLEKTMTEAFEKHMTMTQSTPDSPVSQEVLANERLKDHISHYILRLAYCRSPELRAWFLKAECALFKYRFDRESLEDQIAFLEHQSLFWRRVSDEDKRLLHDKLLECYIGAKFHDEVADGGLEDDSKNEGEAEERAGRVDGSETSEARDHNPRKEQARKRGGSDAQGTADSERDQDEDHTDDDGEDEDAEEDESKSGSRSDKKKKAKNKGLERQADDDENEGLFDFDDDDEDDDDGESKVNIDDVIFFEVDFERAHGLVGRRAVYVKDGKAYVPMAEQVTMVLEMFRDRLSDSLEACALALPGMDEDDRLVPVLDNINDQYLGKDYTTTSITGELHAEDVNGLIFHMPPCMDQLHTELRNAQHLRHGGRMQYGLFLKGIGLPLEQALLFWQKAFGKHTAEQFNKEYAYNIRHSYGMEGKRTDYTPYSCKGIIMGSTPGPGDHHGCPFRHWPAAKLRDSLSARGLDDFDKEDVMQFVQGHHYQLACTRYFEVTRAMKMGILTETLPGGLVEGGKSRVASQETIEHPNQFFEQSYLLFRKPSKTQAKGGSAGDMEVDEEEVKAPLVRGGYTYKKTPQSSDFVPTHPQQQQQQQQQQQDPNVEGAIDLDEDDDDDV
ncbi:hypothetical protein DFQ26_002507, partial [Actinomortierella ambigua]